MAMSGTTLCGRCEALQEEVAALKAEKARLEAELAKARKHSGNSSKPPPSDIVKPPRPQTKDGRKRKQGAQPGHPRHQRPPFEPGQIDDTIDYTLSCCPHCGGPVELSDELPRIVQQVELVAKPIEVVEHRGLAYWCSQCQKTHYAPIDEAVRKAGLIGPGLTTLIAYLKGACHCSFSTIRKFLRDVVGLSISRGHLAKLIRKVSDSLQFAYELLLKVLPEQKVVNTDETGHKDRGDALWTWSFRAPLFTLFKISPSRGASVLLEVLGAEFDGVLGCDYFSAYRKYMGECNVLVQFCLAHLIRDIKYLRTLPTARDRAYGERLREALRGLFAVIHRRDELPDWAFEVRLREARDEVLRQAASCAGHAGEPKPGGAYGEAWESLFRVCHHSGR